MEHPIGSEVRVTSKGNVRARVDRKTDPDDPIEKDGRKRDGYWVTYLEGDDEGGGGKHLPEELKPLDGD